MALKNQVIPAALQAGLDTGKDPKLVSQGMLRLENCVMSKRGELSKRPGLLNLTGEHSDKNLAVYKDRPVLVGDEVARKSGSTVTTGGLDVVGTAKGMGVDTQPITALSNMFSLSAEVQEAGALQAVAYYGFNNVTEVYGWTLDVFDRYSGVKLDTLASDYQIRIITIDDVIYYFKPSAASSPIHYSKVDSDGTINTSMQTITGSSNTFTTFVGWYPFDLCMIADDQMILIHQLTTGAGFEIVGWETPGHGTGTWSVVQNTTPTTMGPIACAKLTDETGVVLWTDIGAGTPEVNALGVNVETTTVVTEATILTNGGGETFLKIAAKAVSATSLRCYITMTSVGTSENGDVTFYNNYINTAGTGSAETAPASAPGWELGVTPVSKPFGVVDAAEHYLLVQRTGYSLADPNWTYWIMDSSAVMVARVLPGYAYTLDTRTVGAVYTRATNTWVMTAIKRTDEETSSVQLLVVTLDPGQIHSVETPEHLQIGGSCPWELDGQQVVEAGFHVYPFHGSAAITTPGGATDIGEGDYGYKVCWEWYDNRGALHRSRPSPTIEITTTSANDVVTLTVPNLFITRKTNVTIAVYRTDVDGSHYYRLKSVANGDTRTQDITDSAGDSTITDNEELYTAGGVRANEPPPPYRVHCIHQQRHVVVNREAESWDIRYSKPFVPNEGMAHSGFFTIACSPEGGRITALRSFGDRLLIFKEDRIYATNGYGLSLNASGQGYREPYLVSESVGCVNQKTIVDTPAGLMFEGADGIYALDKTMRVQAIGDPVRYHYDQVSLTAGAIVPEKHIAIWVSSDGVALVFDYLHGQWFEFTNHLATDCCQAGGILYIKTASGDAVQAENRASHLDDGDAVGMKIRTGWFSFAGLGGFKRVRDILLIGQNVSAHTLRVKTAYDFDPVWVDNQTFDSSDLANYQGPSSHYGAGLAVGYLDKSYLVGLATSRQKCTAIMLEITDESLLEDTVTNGFTLSGLSFLVALKTGQKRLGTGREF